MLIKFNSFDRAEKTVGSTGTVQENLLRQVKEERDNTTQTHSLTQPLTHTKTHQNTHMHTRAEELHHSSELLKHFTFKQKRSQGFAYAFKYFTFYNKRFKT